MKLKLPIDQASSMTARQIMNYYWPGMKDEEIDFILWETTAFPFCGMESLLDTIYEQYTHEMTNLASS